MKNIERGKATTREQQQEQQEQHYNRFLVVVVITVTVTIAITITVIKPSMIFGKIITIVIIILHYLQSQQY